MAIRDARRLPDAVLLSKGRDNPAGLFGYVALLDIGLIAVARPSLEFWCRRRGRTFVMQLGWAAKFLNATKAPTAMVLCSHSAFIPRGVFRRPEV